MALQLGQSAGWDVSVPPGALDLKVSMAYPDPPGTTAARLHRINDLDLRVISPSGEEGRDVRMGPGFPAPASPALTS